MKYTEIDGVRYDVVSCADCPFYNNGEFKMGLYHSDCKHPSISEVWQGYTTTIHRSGVSVEEVVCPLREVKE